jgi:hypothetical protein
MTRKEQTYKCAMQRKFNSITKAGNKKNLKNIHSYSALVVRYAGARLIILSMFSVCGLHTLTVNVQKLP